MCWNIWSIPPGSVRTRRLWSIPMDVHLCAVGRVQPCGRLCAGRVYSPWCACCDLDEKIHSAVSAFMGCVYAGCFYVYLSPDQPKTGERILSVAQARLVITTRDFCPKWQEMGLGGEVLLYENLAAQRSDDARLAAIRARSGMWIRSTAISPPATGTPKGVVVSHRSVIDFMNFFRNCSTSPGRMCWAIRLPLISMSQSRTSIPHSRPAQRWC